MNNYDTIATLDHAARMEAASAYQQVKIARQTMYDLAKKADSFWNLYDETQNIYVKLCARLRVQPEPVFDREAYEKSERYQDILSGRIR